MTRLELEARIYDWLNKAGTATIDSNTQRRIRAYLNDDIRDVLSRPGFEPLRMTTATFASVASQDAYGLPLEFARIDRIVDQSNYLALTERDLGWLRTVQPNPSPSGTPYVWVPYGWGVVMLQPSNASELFAKSTSAADTTQTITVAGFLTGGLARTSSAVTLNGLTAVSIGASLTTWEQVSRITLSAACGGVISLHEDSGAGTMLAQIPIAKTSSRYQTIRLWPTPSGVQTYHVDGLMAITDLASDVDSPMCPEDFHELFVFGAVYRELLKLDDKRANDFKAMHTERLGKLRAFVNDNASKRVVPHAYPIGRSNLGPWAPADWRW
jgi:hypothetical protein